GALPGRPGPLGVMKERRELRAEGRGRGVIRPAGERGGAHRSERLLLAILLERGAVEDHRLVELRDEAFELRQGDVETRLLANPVSDLRKGQVAVEVPDDPEEALDRDQDRVRKKPEGVVEPDEIAALISDSLRRERPQGGFDEGPHPSAPRRDPSAGESPGDR